MSISDNQSSVFQDEAKISALQNRVMTDAFALQVAEQVLTNIERLILKAASQSYDLSKIRDSLAEYKQACAEKYESVSKIEFRLLQELQFWRLTLARRDEKIKAFHLRKYYDAYSLSLTPKVLAGLACFYRGLMPTFEIRSKYDFVVTRLFSGKLPGKPRFVRINEADLVARLQKFNYAWTGIESDWVSADDRKRREDAVAVFELLRKELNNFGKLEELLRSGFFGRVLRHKQYLGENFYAPEVTAASIQYNVAVGNKFSHLVSTENLEFQDLLKTEHGDAESLNLILEENPAHSETLLRQISAEFTDTEKQEKLPDENSDSEILDSEFDEITQTKAKEFETADEAEKSETVFCKESQTVADAVRQTKQEDFFEEQDELQPAIEKLSFLQVLSELNRQRPDEKMLRDYLSDSPVEEAGNLDLTLYFTFVEHATEREQNLKRQSLRLIFIADDYWRRIGGFSSEAVSDEDLTALLEEMQTVGNDLRVCINVIAGENVKERANVLLSASNDLLETRLRLNSATSKKSNLESSKRIKELSKSAEKFLADLKNNQSETELPKESEENPAVEFVAIEKTKAPIVNKTLLLVAVLTILIGGVYHFYTFTASQTETEVEQIADAKTIDVKTLSGGEHLLVAKVNRKVLIGVVNAEWNSLSPENKREKLSLLLSQGAAHNFETVLLFNSKGDIVGNAAKQEIKIN